MSSARFGLILCLLLPSVIVRAQQAQTPSGQTPPPSAQQTQPAPTRPPATKDPQAVNVVNQALSMAGGVPAITATTDYTATGNITYHWTQDVQGTVTLRGNGFGQFRLDANLPDGVHSESINAGQTTRKNGSGAVQQIHYQTPLNPNHIVLPYIQLRAAVSSPGFSLEYKGLVDLGGHSAHDIQVVQVQRIMPKTADPTGRFRAYLTMDYFIDASTFQVLMVQDIIPRYLIRQLNYSDYRPVNGLSLPFSISEQVSGIPTMLIQLNNVIFDSGLQGSDFQL